MKRASTIRREAEGGGNAGAVESGQNQTQVLPVSHYPLKIPQNRRDSHISTAPACTAWKSGKPKTGFPLSHPAHATMMTVLSVNSETKERKSAATRPPHSPAPISCSSFNWKMLNHTKTAMQKGAYAMKSLLEVCVVGSILICAAGAQESTQPALQKGVSVQMPVADHAVEMREADAQLATVIAITADGKLFAGTEPTEPSALSKLRAGTVYVKADSRVPFQRSDERRGGERR